MIGLSILALGVAFLVFATVYRLALIRKQREQARREVGQARAAELAVQRAARSWYTFQARPAVPEQPAPPDKEIPFKEPFFISQPDGHVDVAIQIDNDRSAEAVSVSLTPKEPTPNEQV